MKNRKKIHDDWETPKKLLEMIKNEYFSGNEFFDPCPIQPSFDGLAISWRKYNFINPPYNRKDKESFINKALRESNKGNICVMLLPVSTSTRIFHDVILPFGNVRFLKGRDYGRATFS